jgi:hypothetical protein
MATDTSRLGGIVARLRTTSKRRLVRTGAFYLSVLAFVFFWVLAFGFHLGAVFYTWFDPVLADTIHFVHNVALATWVWVWGAAMVVQLYRPATRVTTMQVALLLTLADMGVGFVSTGPLAVLTSDAMLFFAPVFVAAALHPARRELLHVRGLSREHVSIVLLGLAALAVVPAGLYAAGQLQLQQTLPDEHAAFGHYATMVYYTLSVLGLSLLASLRSRNRRFAAYGAGLLAVMFAIASVFNPTTSGLSSTWAAFAALWGVVFVGAYEWTVRRDAPVHEAVPSEDVPLAP